MGSFYDGIDCLLVASRWEASSMAALEAGAAGVPTLAPDQSGTRDLVEYGKLGWLFPTGQPEELAKVIVRLARRDELRSWRRDEQAVRRFMSPSVAQQHLQLYRERLSA